MTANRIIAGDAIGVLSRIADPTVDLAVWHRRPAPALADWLERLGPERLPQGRVLVSHADLRQAIAAIFAESGTPESEGSRCLADDVAMLARCFATLARTDRVDIRLEVVDGDGCWKFHRDRTAIRLLSTYLGAGTQWVPHAQAADALHRQRAYDGPIGQLPRHAVGILRGCCDDDPDIGMLHRSPPTADDGSDRLLLAISPPSTASPAPFRAGV